jgi:hypothetical protein
VATGITLPANLANSTKVFIGEMQYIQENEPVTTKLMDTIVLPPGSGLIYNEPVLGTVNAFAGDRNTEFSNPQTLSDSKLQFTPTEKLTQILWPKSMARQWTGNWVQAVARETIAAIEYYRDQDLAAILATAAGVMGGGTIPFNAGLVSAGMAVIGAGYPANGNAARTGARASGEPSKPPYYCMIHPFNQHDIDTQLTGVGGGVSQALVGGYDVKGGFPATGITSVQEGWIRGHFTGSLHGADIFKNGNLPIASNVVKGILASRWAAVQLTYQGIQNGMSESGDTRFVKQTTWIDYGGGIRNPVWIQVLSMDATIPTG